MNDSRIEDKFENLINLLNNLNSKFDYLTITLSEIYDELEDHSHIINSLLDYEGLSAKKIEAHWILEDVNNKDDEEE